MLTADVLARGPGFSVSAVACADEHPHWSQAETRAGYGLVLVGRGWFRRRAGGVAATVDPTVGYLCLPGEQESFAHPAGGDLCTYVELSADLWRQMAGDRARPARTAVHVDARLELAHRRMLAAASGDAGHGLAGELLALVAAAVRRTVAGPAPIRDTGGGSAPGRRKDAAMASAAREAIVAGHPAAEGLFPLAELLEVSPYRLSRAFSREAGMSLTHYRNRVRVSRALERLAAGERSLAMLAADLGFSDQAHLTRTVRAHAGHTPAALRRLLKEKPAAIS